MDALVRSIRDGLAALEQRMDMRPHDVVHGDFYEAQVFVENGKVVGLLDIDTVGPGRRSDDLACLLAHLSVLADYGNAGRIDRATQERVEEAIRTWHEVFSDRVDPTELALRSAGVVLRSPQALTASRRRHGRPPPRRSSASPRSGSPRPEVPSPSGVRPRPRSRRAAPRPPAPSDRFRGADGRAPGTA